MMSVNYSYSYSCN